MSEEIKRETILNAVAPCAFCCLTCSAMKGGIIEEASKKLSHYLDGYYEFGKKNFFGKYRSYSKKIKLFTEQLARISAGNCGGCRSGADGKCCIPNCFILECSKQHRVDFCGECNEFPCKKAEEFFNGKTLEEWVNNNCFIKDNGAQSYYEDAVSRSHYHFYKL